MAPNTLSFNCDLITGGGGIGRTVAEYLISIGKKVIIVRRTESNLQTASKELGNGTSYYVLNTGSIKDILSSAQKVIKEYLEVDCLINNVGVQRELYIEDFDLGKADQEIDIKYSGADAFDYSVLAAL